MEVKEWHVAKFVERPSIAESINARENVMKEIVGLVQEIPKDWSSALVVIIRSNNWLVGKEKLAQIQSQTAHTLVIDIYHVDSINARRNAIQVSVKLVMVWLSNHVDVAETPETLLATQWTILMTSKKKSWLLKRLKTLKCTSVTKFAIWAKNASAINARRSAVQLEKGLTQMACTCVCWNVIRLFLVAFTNAMIFAMLVNASRAEFTQENLYSAHAILKRLIPQSNAEQFSQRAVVHVKKYCHVVTGAL